MSAHLPPCALRWTVSGSRGTEWCTVGVGWAVEQESSLVVEKCEDVALAALLASYEPKLSPGTSDEEGEGD